ncbi:hypothetical protein ACFE04_009673 [Oxalis oulophora]
MAVNRGVDLCCFTTLVMTTTTTTPPPALIAYPYIRNHRPSLRCCSSSRNGVELEEATSSSSSGNDNGIEEHVMRFNMSDFDVLDRVSIGLGGRADEVVYEALLKDTQCSLNGGTKLVLRQLITAQAQRRGRRAIQVLKKLAPRRLMYHSYSMQVHGYVASPTSARASLTLVHGYHGSFSLRHWLQMSDWLPTLEATLALDEESVKRVGDNTVGGPAVSRQLRIIRILMRDLLIGVNYLHSHGLAHTELRLENIHISPVDRHIKVGILGNAADFYESNPDSSKVDNNMDRRLMMIAFDMRCVGFMMAKMVLRELMEPSIFAKFKSFLTKGNDPSCLREFLLQILNRNSPAESGFQILDRNWGAGWHLLSLLLATKSSKRIRYRLISATTLFVVLMLKANLDNSRFLPNDVSTLDALRHPFLCGPKWRVVPSVDIIRWGLGSTAVKITEEYIYRQPQRGRLAHFIELLEMLNPHSKPKNWLELLPGKWRLLYCTGRQIGLTLRQPLARALVGDVHLTISRASKLNTKLSFTSEIGFNIIIGQDWPHDKTGVSGNLQVDSVFKLMAGRRLFLNEESNTGEFSLGSSHTHNYTMKKLSGEKWKKAMPFKEFPSSLPAAKLSSGDIEVRLRVDKPLDQNIDVARNITQEVRMQVPPEMFDLSKIVCGTYVDSRILVLRGVNGSALLFTRLCTL